MALTVISEILRRVSAGLWNQPLTDEQLAQFERYAELLTEWNATRMNLTRITDPREIAVKHFLDSLLVLQAVPFPKQSRVIDIGAGAGLPGLALKIARPDLRMTLLDSTAKKLQFCDAVIETLALSQVETVHARAEEAGERPSHRGQYDLAVARAVAPLERLLPWCAPFVRSGGRVVAMKGSRAEEELRPAQPAAKRLGLVFQPLIALELPEADEPTLRQIVVAEKSPLPKR